MMDLQVADPFLPIYADIIGLPHEQALAALSTMERAGISSDCAVTSLRQLLLTLGRPTTDLASLLADLGFADTAAALRELGLDGLLAAIQVQADGDAMAMHAMYGTIWAMRAGLALSPSAMPHG